jgi:hypothetical protein
MSNSFSDNDVRVLLQEFPEVGTKDADDARSGFQVALQDAQKLLEAEEIGAYIFLGISRTSQGGSGKALCLQCVGGSAIAVHTLLRVGRAAVKDLYDCGPLELEAEYKKMVREVGNGN